MVARPDVLGALLENVAESQVASAQHVAGIVAAERKKRAGEPTGKSFEAAKHPRGAKGTTQGGKFVAKGSSGTPVRKVQAALGQQQTGHFAFDTQAAVENFQRAHGLQVDGVVGAQTAQALLGNRNAKTVTPGALSAADRKALGVSSTKSSKRASTKKPAAFKPSAPTRIGGGIVV